MSDHSELHKVLRQDMPADFPTDAEVEIAARTLVSILGESRLLLDGWRKIARQVLQAVVEARRNQER